MKVQDWMKAACARAVGQACPDVSGIEMTKPDKWGRGEIEVTTGTGIVRTQYFIIPNFELYPPQKTSAMDIAPIPLLDPEWMKQECVAQIENALGAVADFNLNEQTQTFTAALLRGGGVAGTYQLENAGKPDVTVIVLVNGQRLTPYTASVAGRSSLPYLHTVLDPQLEGKTYDQMFDDLEAVERERRTEIRRVNRLLQQYGFKPEPVERAMQLRVRAPRGTQSAAAADHRQETEVQKPTPPANPAPPPAPVPDPQSIAPAWGIPVTIRVTPPPPPPPAPMPAPVPTRTSPPPTPPAIPEFLKGADRATQIYLLYQLQQIRAKMPQENSNE